MTTIKRHITSAVGACALLSSFSAHAEEDTGFRKITDIGCRHNAGICFVTLDDAPFGASIGCKGAPTNEFRFDDGDTVIGRRTFAALLAALIVTLMAGCTADKSTFSGRSGHVYSV